MVMVLYLRASLGVKWSFLKMHGRKKICNIHISGMSGTSLMHRRWGLPKKCHKSLEIGHCQQSAGRPKLKLVV